MGVRPVSLAPTSPDDAVIVDRRDSDRLVIAFGGVCHALNMPPTEFRRWSQTTDWSWIFVRDLRQSWYTRGVSDDLRDPGYVLARLLVEANAAAPSEIVTIGTSAGGFAAIWFGLLLNVDRVVAMSPQTTIAEDQIRGWPDNRFIRALEPLWSDGVRIPDLRTMLDENRFDRPDVHVHVCAGNEPDMRHARHIQGRRGVIVRSHLCNVHNVAGWMRDQGLLAGAIRGTL